MPTYEYICERCGKFEAFQSMNEASLSKCPTCGGPVRRMISGGAGLIFKGSGFYITDHRNSEYRTKAKEDSGKQTASTQAQAQDKPSGAADKSAKGGEGTDGGGDSKGASEPK